MLKLEMFNGFTRITDGPLPFVDVVFSYSPTDAARYVAIEKVRTLLELAEAAPEMISQLEELQAARNWWEIECQAAQNTVTTLRAENNQMRQAIAALKRELLAATRKDVTP